MVVMRSKSHFSLLNILMLVLNIPIALLLAASYLADVVYPGKMPVFSFAGLVYPWLLMLNLIFVIYWLVQRHRLFLLSLVMILAGFSSLMRYYQYGGRMDSVPDDPSMFRLMSYNVQLFGRYHLDSAGDRSLHTEYRDTIMQTIARVHPDLLCLQEFSHQAKNFPTIPMMREKLPWMRYCYPVWRTKNPDHYNGNAIYSRYPIVNGGAVGFSTMLDNRSAMFADIKVGDDTVRIYNIHLQSVQFQKEDYDFARQVTTAGNSEKSEEFSSGSKRMFGKLRSAFQIRCVQVDSIVCHIDQSPYPVLVCGDFNDTPWSYTYHQFRKRLKDSQVHSGYGRGNTFVLNRLLRFRIDFLFYPSSWENYGHTVLRVPASDHYPVYCHLKPSLQTD